MEAKSVYVNGILRLMISNPGEHLEAVKGAYYHENGDYYIKEFTGKFQNAEKIMKNFEHLAPLMFEKGDWEKALLFIAETCQKNGVVWFLTGSACDAVRGIDICPHDLDVEIYSKHWIKSEVVFEDFIIEPYIDTNGWVRDYFGRLVVENTQIDVVADERYDFPQHEYEPYMWKGYRLWLEPFNNRYKTEIIRDRKDRIKKIDEFIKLSGIE
jgi:hypothetical protein